MITGSSATKIDKRDNLISPTLLPGIIVTVTVVGDSNIQTAPRIKTRKKPLLFYFYAKSGLYFKRSDDTSLLQVETRF